MSDTSGPTSQRQFAFYDHDSSCWRMWPVISLWGSEKFSETFPASGSMRSGKLYEHRTSGPPTAAPDSSLLRTPQASVIEAKEGIRLTGRTPADPQVGLADQVKALLPTPTANQFETEDMDAYLERRERCKETAQNGNGFGLVLSMAVRMLPTPEASDGTGPRLSKELGGKRPSGAKRAITLATALNHALLPTPQARDGDSRGTQRASERIATGHQADLPEVVRDLLPTPRATRGGSATETVALLPTPTTSDAKGPSPNHSGTTSEAIGALTAPPSPDTPPCSDDLPLTLWTEEEDFPQGS